VAVLILKFEGFVLWEWMDDSEAAHLLRRIVKLATGGPTSWILFFGMGNKASHSHWTNKPMHSTISIDTKRPSSALINVWRRIQIVRKTKLSLQHSALMVRKWSTAIKSDREERSEGEGEGEGDAMFLLLSWHTTRGELLRERKENIQKIFGFSWECDRSDEERLQKNRPLDSPTLSVRSETDDQVSDPDTTSAPPGGGGGVSHTDEEGEERDILAIDPKLLEGLLLWWVRAMRPRPQLPTLSLSGYRNYKHGWMRSSCSWSEHKRLSTSGSSCWIIFEPSCIGPLGLMSTRWVFHFRERKWEDEDKPEHEQMPNYLHDKSKISEEGFAPSLQFNFCRGRSQQRYSNVI
jgi:hypothetical protein